MVIKTIAEMKSGRKILLLGNAAALLLNLGCSSHTNQFMKDWKRASVHPVKFSREKGKAKTAGYWVLNIAILGAAVEGVALASGDTTPIPH